MENPDDSLLKFNINGLKLKLYKERIETPIAISLVDWTTYTEVLVNWSGVIMEEQPIDTEIEGIAIPMTNPHLIIGMLGPPATQIRCYDDTWIIYALYSGRIIVYVSHDLDEDTKEGESGSSMV